MLDPDDNNSSLRRALGILRLMAKADGQGMRVKDLAQAVAALSVGTLAERLNADRIPFVAQILQREALSLGARLNPFDVSLRYPSRRSSISGSLKA